MLHDTLKAAASCCSLGLCTQANVLLTWSLYCCRPLFDRCLSVPLLVLLLLLCLAGPAYPELTSNWTGSSGNAAQAAAAAGRRIMV